MLADTNRDRNNVQAEGAPRRSRHPEGELAGPGQDWQGLMDSLLGYVPNRDPVLARHRADIPEYQDTYGLYKQLRDGDAHLQSVLEQRKLAVLSCPRSVQPADASPEAAAQAALVSACLDALGDWEQALGELWEARYYGFALQEILWGWDAALQAVAPVALKSRDPGRFVFDPQHQPRLLTRDEPVKGVALPERKFLRYTPQMRFDDPYGVPLARTAYRWVTPKKFGFKFWTVFLEKFGSPTAYVEVPDTNIDADTQAKYRRLVTSIQQQTGFLLDPGFKVAYLEAQRSGATASYHEFEAFCNAEVSKLVLGQTLTTEQGERGARALGAVHWDVRQDLVRSDAESLAAFLNATLLRWIVDFNVPEGARKYPRLVIKVDPPVQAAERMDVYAKALALGVEVSLEQVREDCNLRLPKGAGDTIGAKPASPGPGNATHAEAELASAHSGLTTAEGGTQGASQHEEGEAGFAPTEATYVR